jgi:autotransporter-associated beta strand protein
MWAATRTWNGGLNGNFSTAGNWVGSIVPVAGDDLVFPTGVSRLLVTNDFSPNRPFRSLSFLGSNYFVRGITIQVTNGISSSNPTGPNDVDAAVDVRASQAWEVLGATARLDCNGAIALNTNTLTVRANPGDVNFGGILSGTGNIIKTNSGTLRMNAAGPNTYTGFTRLDAGGLELGNAGTAIVGDLIVGDGNGILASDIVTLFDNDQIAPSADVTVKNSGWIDFNGHTNQLNALILQGGRIDVGANQPGPDGLVILGGNVTGLADTNIAVLDGDVTLGGVTRTFAIAAGADVEIGARIAPGPGTAGLIKSGPGTLRLSGKGNTYNGTTTINDGQVVIPAAASTPLGATTAGTILNGDATLFLEGNVTIGAEPLTINSTNLAGALIANGTSTWRGNIQLNADTAIFSSGSLSLSGSMTGSGGFTKLAPGSLTLSGTNANTYTGTTRVIDGVLQLNKDTSAVLNGALGGALVIGENELPENADVVLYLQSSQLPDATDITLNASGLLNLNGFTEIVHNLVFNGGDITTGAGSIVPGGNIAVNQNPISQAVISGGLNVTNSPTINVTGHFFSPDLRIDARVFGPGGITKNGPGQVGLTSSNSYSGLTTINDGILFIDNSFALGSTTSGVTVNDGGAMALRFGIQVPAEPLTLAGRGQAPFGALHSVVGSNSYAGNIVLSTNVTITVETNELNLSGAVTGSFDITLIGPGTNIFSGGTANSFGRLFINSGTLVLDKTILNSGPVEITIGDGLGGVAADRLRLLRSDQIPSLVPIHIVPSGLLDMNGFSDIVGSIDGAGRIDLGGGTLRAGNDGGSTIYSGLITGAGTLFKVGPGTWTLAGTNTYTGLTTVSAGTLLVDGSQPGSPVTVSSSATLGGSGTVGNLNISGNLRPGSGPSPATLASSNVVFSSSGDFFVKLNGPEPGTGYDQLNVRGTNNLGGAALQLSLGFPPFEGQEFVILNNDGAELVGGTFNGLPNGALVFVNNLAFRIRYDNDVTLLVTNVGLRFVEAVISGGNGDAKIDPNECNLLNIVLRNVTGGQVSGITATLIPKTPGVAVIRGDANYPNIPASAPGTNSTPFQFSVSPAFSCGTSVAFDLVLRTATNGFFTVPFTLPSGSADAPVRFDSSAVVSIPDNGFIEVPITVSNIFTPIKRVVVATHITHAAASQLDISLLAPDGTSVDLSSDNGGSLANYGSGCIDEGRTVFSDLASTAITTAAAPFVGTFRPEQTLAGFNEKTGAAVNGVWRLRVADDTLGTVGTVRCWSLFLSPTTCTDGGGGCESCPDNRTIRGVLGPGSLTQTNQLNRNLTASICGVNKACPGSVAGSPTNRFYDAYTFENGDTNACISVTLQASCDLFCAAYANAYVPPNVCQNYLADAGISSAQTGGTNAFSFNVGPGARFVVVVNGINSDDFCGYTLTVDGGDCRSAQRCVGTTQGTNFWFTIPGNASPDLGEVTRPYLSILGTPGTRGTVEIVGLNFQSSFQIGLNMSAIVTLTNTADLGNALEIIENKGVQVTSTAPISVTVFNDLAFTTDAYLVTPSDVLGRHHIVTAYGNLHDEVPTLNGSQLALVAIADDTVVQIQLSAPVGTHPKGALIPLLLQKGQTYQLRATNSGRLDLTGTTLDSDRPIAVFAGHQCATIPSSNVFFCNYVCEQSLPIAGWGTNFYTVPLLARSNDTFRCVASVANTRVSTNGVLAASLVKAGDFVEFQLLTATRITTTQPAFVAQFGNSSDYDRRAQADPTMITLPSYERWQKSYTIFSPPDFTNYVNVAIPIQGQMEILLDNVRLSSALLDTGRGFLIGQVPVPPGTHQLAGFVFPGFAAPFLAVAYGYSTNRYDAYGYVAGMELPDGTPPVLTAPSSMVLTVGGDCLATVPLVPVTAVDACALPGMLLRTQQPPAGTVITVGVYSITNTVLDTLDNLSRFVTTLIVRDPRPPTILCPTNRFVECTNPAGNVVLFDAPATSACGTFVRVVCDPPSGSLFRLGTNLVVCRTADPSVPTNQCAFSVIVRNTTPPILSCPPALVFTSSDGGPVRVVYPLSATDACSSNVSIVCTPPSGSFFRVGQSNVVCTASDGLTNSSCAFLVRILEPPLVIVNPVLTGGVGRFSFPSLTGITYTVEFKTNLLPINQPWFVLTNVTGIGAPVSVADTNVTRPTRFYRIRR